MSFTIVDSRGQQDWTYIEAVRHAGEQAKLTPGVGFYVVEKQLLVRLDPDEGLPKLLDPE